MTDALSVMNVPPVVIDNGSSTCKAGYGGEDTPCVILSTSTDNQGIPCRPIQNGVVADWDSMESVCTSNKSRFCCSP